MALALDWYFKIDDVHGDAVDPQHQTWIETYSWKLGSKDAGMGAGRNRIKQLTVVIVAGTASARIMSAKQTGRTFMKAQLHGVLNGKPVEGSEYRHLRVVHFAPAGRRPNGPLTEVTFDCDVL